MKKIIDAMKKCRYQKVGYLTMPEYNTQFSVHVNRFLKKAAIVINGRGVYKVFGIRGGESESELVDIMCFLMEEFYERRRMCA